MTSVTSMKRGFWHKCESRPFHFYPAPCCHSGNWHARNLFRTSSLLRTSSSLRKRPLLRLVRLATTVVWATPILAQVVVTCLLKSSYPHRCHSDRSLVDENLPVPSHHLPCGLGPQQIPFHFMANSFIA